MTEPLAFGDYGAGGVLGLGSNGPPLSAAEPVTITNTECWFQLPRVCRCCVSEVGGGRTKRDLFAGSSNVSAGSDVTIEQTSVRTQYMQEYQV